MIIRTSTLASIAIHTAAAVTPSAHAQLNDCVVSGQLSPGISMHYKLQDDGYASLSMGMQVTQITYAGIDNRADVNPFVEFDFPIRSDGLFFENTYAVVLYIGDNYSQSSGTWIDEYTSTVVFGDDRVTQSDLDVRGSFIKYPASPNNLGLIGPARTPLDEFLTKLKSGESLSVDAYNPDNPSEKITANVDMAAASSAFLRIENVDQMMRERAQAGGCAPVDH